MPPAVAHDGGSAAHVLLVAVLPRRLKARLVRACPVEQPIAEQLAIAQRPLVGAQVMDDVAVVEDRLATRRELETLGELAGLLRGTKPVAREAVGPLIGAAQRLRPETLHEPRLEQARHASAHSAQPAALPPQLGNLPGRKKPVPSKRDQDLEVARLKRARGPALALTPAQQLALGETQLGVRVQRRGHATSNSVGCCVRKRSSSRAARIRSAALTRSSGSNSSKTCA